MAHYKKIAKKLGLNDVGELEFGKKLCEECGTQLRIGEEILPKDKAEKIYPNTFSYCPKCKKRGEVVLIPRIARPIKVEPHDD